jgi:hypothetical protein
MGKQRDNYEEGYQDSTHGGDRNPPAMEGVLGTIFNQDWEDKANRDYHRGYDAGKKKR